MIDRTLEGMGRGGVYDQLGGGFHRYSVDAQWIVPHFEKMSYDNSELLKAYARAFALFGAEEYAEVARGIVRWVREVMADPEVGSRPARTPTSDSTTTGTISPGPGTKPPPSSSAEEMEIAAGHYDIGTAGRCITTPAETCSTSRVGRGHRHDEPAATASEVRRAFSTPPASSCGRPRAGRCPSSTAPATRAGTR